LSSEAFETCRKCGAVMQRVSEENQSPVIMACSACAHREHAETQATPEFNFENVEIGCRRVVVCRGSKKTSAKEVRALRSLCADLASLPMTEAIKRIESSKYIDLGVYPSGDAQLLLMRAEALGLKAVLDNPDESSIADLDESNLYESSGTPVSVGAPGVDSIVIPYVWIIIFVALILAAIVWLLL